MSNYGVVKDDETWMTIGLGFSLLCAIVVCLFLLFGIVVAFVTHPLQAFTGIGILGFVIVVSACLGPCAVRLFDKWID